MLKWLVCLASVGLAIGVSVNKCCPDNHTLFGTVCKPAVVEPWAPVIYNPMKRSFLQPGTFPEDWTFNVSFPKTCDVRALDFLSMDANPPFVIFVNGNLNAEGSVNPFIETDSYCIDSKGALICLEPDREDKIAVQKCCGHKGIYSEKKRSCQLSTVSESEFSHLRVLHKFPDCADRNSGYFIGGKMNVSHFLQKDGSLKEKGGRILTKTQFCLEKIAESPDEPAHVFTCPPTVKHRHDDIRFTVYPMGLFLSVFFLAVTLIASCLLPSTYHVLHWRCQTNHVACLLVGDFLLAITQLSGEALRGPACFGTAIAMHFFFLAAFFWLNTMCFNIWWTFRTWSFVPWPMGPLHQSRDFFYFYERAVHTNEFGIFFRKDLRPASLDKSQEACRLRIYELYAWGGPLVIAGIAAFMDCLPEGSNPTFLRPRFGQNRCWFYGDAELLSYFFGPIGILLVFNLTLFAATARELTCGLWKTEVVKSNTERATLGRVCLKLVVVMGVTWVADVISWVVGGPDYVWFLTDVINTLQGVLIFIVVGCQPQVWAAVKRLWCLREQPGDNAHIRSSTSQAPPSLGDQSITKPVETLC